jgi:DNA polymerase-1
MIWEYHQHGIGLDQDHFRKLSRTLHEKSESLQEELDFVVGHPVNANSGDQVAHLIFHELGLVSPLGDPKMTASNKREVVDDEVLSSLKSQSPIVQIILDKRQVDKLLGTYVDKLPGMVGEDGRLRTTFRHTVAATGRLASENPNLQNIPTRTKDGMQVRYGFVAEKDSLGRQCKLVSLDLSQIEMVLAGHLSRDEVLLNAFIHGADIHTLTAINCFRLDREWLMYLSQKAALEDAGSDPGWLPGEKEEWKKFKLTKRLPAKTVGFGILYGQTASGAQSNILAQGGPFLEIPEVEAIINGWFGTYRGVADWMAYQHSRALRYGMVWDMWGRTRLIPEALSALKRIRSEGLRQAGNMPIQSSAQGLIKLDMAQLMPVVEYFQSFPDVRCWPLLQIHDELIFELSPNIVDEFCELAHAVMTTNVKLLAPVKASYGVAERWGDLK